MMSQSVPLDISSTFLRLRGDASVEPLSVDNTLWQRVMSGQLGDFHNEFLVAGGSCDADWARWEMHPNGDEIVCVLSGSVAFVIQHPDGNQTIELGKSGEYVLIPKGTWHIAKARGQCHMLFITPGEGTQHRPAT
jgi:mannose-6-phosphate isomerase-like protein (cupin superfamily)